MTPTVVVIPSRYERARITALAEQVAKEAEVIILDNGHEPPLDIPGVTIVDARGDGIYKMWNRGWRMALERYPVVNVAVINDDVLLKDGTITLMANALREADEKIGCVYPDVGTGWDRDLPEKIDLVAEWDPAGGRSLSGFCFMFKGELPIPAFDEGMEWWYGDSEFDEEIKKAGYGVAQIRRLPIFHISDTELNDWARRPDLKEATGRDGARWAERHARIVNGWWVPAGPKVVLLVPRRDDHDWRDKVWEYCKARWRKYAPDVQIVEGHHYEGPFNRSKAINTAARLADEDGLWDIAVVIDSDVLVKMSQFRAAIETVRRTGLVTWGHRRWRSIGEEWTGRVLKDHMDLGADVDATDIDILVERTNPISWSCCIAIPRAVWDDLGGFDERFVGWGFEDMAFQSVICGLYGWERIEGDVYHLWHPRGVTTGGRASKEAGLYTREAITNARLGRRYMVALRRDHALHDRSDVPSSEEERLRDVGNLKKDDEKLGVQARRLGMPDWSDWWPTLVELREGARRTEIFMPTHTIIVHTDGRREYIEKSIASLMEQVSGNIIKRVIYDDSGDPGYKDWLEHQFGPMGFYVVGPAKRLGYTGSMAAMWKYLQERCNSEYVFAVEDDFTYEEPVDLDAMAEVLLRRPQLAQIALLRQPAYQSEIDKGGVLGWPSESFEQVRHNGSAWMEHRNFWTANPSLFRRSITVRQWPQAKSSERVFGDQLLMDPNTRFAFWGQGQAQMTHIGAIRAGTGY